MSCWLLAMVTHARLQSELQVRDPLVRSVSFASFISCPLLLKQRGEKKRRKSIGEGSKANQLAVLTIKKGCSWVHSRGDLGSHLHRGDDSPAATAAQAAQGGGGWSPGEEGSAQAACRR